MASSRAIIKELQRHAAANKASDDNKPFDPGGGYSPAAVATAFLGKKGDDGVILGLTSMFSFILFLNF